MKSKPVKGYIALAVAGVCLFVANGANAAKNEKVTVIGQDDESVDRQAIQAAIDSAPSKQLVVRLRGIFQLDGQDIIIDRSDLSIKAGKQGATLKGKLGPDGLPIDDINNFPNRGFVIMNDTDLENIEIEELTLSGLRTAIFVNRRGGNPAPIEVMNVSIKENIIVNNTFGVVAIGASDIQIRDNYISDANQYGVRINNVTDAVIENNFVSTADVCLFPCLPVPFYAFDSNTNVLVKGNTMQGGAAAIVLTDNSTAFTVTENCIKDGGSQGDERFRFGGLLVDQGPVGNGSGFEVENNSYANNIATFQEDPPQLRDIWFRPTSSDNTVLESIGTVVLNEGINNSVVLHGDGDPGFCE